MGGCGIYGPDGKGRHCDRSPPTISRRVKTPKFSSTGGTPMSKPNRGFLWRAPKVASRCCVAGLIAVLSFLCSRPANAGILGPAPGLTTADITVTLGGGPLDSTGTVVTLLPYPDFLDLGVGAGSFPYGYYRGRVIFSTASRWRQPIRGDHPVRTSLRNADIRFRDRRDNGCRAETCRAHPRGVLPRWTRPASDNRVPWVSVPLDRRAGQHGHVLRRHRVH